MFDIQLAREIVSLASSRTEDRYTRTWLKADERGTFEAGAMKWIRVARERGMDPESAALKEEIADHLRFLALQAQINKRSK